MDNNKKFQLMLQEYGYYQGAIDGQLGPKTLEALKQALKDTGKSIITKPFEILKPKKSELKTTSKYKLSSISSRKLEQAHPDLQKIVRRAVEITEIDFKVGETLRTVERQRELVRKGASKTMNSRHLTGHAVDLIALENGKASWHWPYYDKIAKAMKQAAAELEIPLEWGGDWKSFKDGPHYQLPWKMYPK